MKKRLWIVLCICMVGSAFGLDAGMDFALHGFIDKQVKAGKKSITIPAGRQHTARSRD